MCLAVPGKIIAIKEDKATVDYGEEQREATILEDNYAVGEYVIIQGGFVVIKIPEDEAKASLEMYAQAVSD